MTETLAPERPRRWLIACDKFKGTLDSLAVGQAVAKGLQSKDPDAEIRVLAVSDGGQGFLQTLSQTHNLEILEVPCQDALGRIRQGQIAWDAAQATVYVESAQALGLPWLKPAERNPWLCNSAGLGDLLTAAWQLNPHQVYIGLGGSATCDGGLGCLSRLGWQFLDASNSPLAGIPASLALIRKIVPPVQAFNREPGLKLICDVANPPVGERGGVVVYSPQKGADSDTVHRLELGMQNWVSVLQKQAQRQAPADLRFLPAGGAAGCLGLGLSQVLEAELDPGASWILDQLNFTAALTWADRIVTGEGAFDASSWQGKITGEILKQAAEQGKRTVLISGQVVTSQVAEQIFCLQTRDPLAETSAGCSRKLLEQIGRELAVSKD